MSTIVFSFPRRMSAKRRQPESTGAMQRPALIPFISTSIKADFKEREDRCLLIKICFLGNVCVRVFSCFSRILPPISIFLSFSPSFSVLFQSSCLKHLESNPDRFGNLKVSLPTMSGIILPYSSRWIIVPIQNLYVHIKCIFLSILSYLKPSLLNYPQSPSSSPSSSPFSLSYNHYILPDVLISFHSDITS